MTNPNRNIYSLPPARTFAPIAPPTGSNDTPDVPALAHLLSVRFSSFFVQKTAEDLKNHVN